MGSGDAPDLAKRLEFHIKEFETLRAEIAFYSAEIRFTERAAVICPVAAYSWLAVQPEKLENTPIVIMAWWLPLVLIGFIWRRKRHAENSILRIAGYLRMLEEQVALPSLRGWEHHVHGLRSDRNTRWRKFGRSYWIGIFILCLAIPLVATFSKLPIGARIIDALSFVRGR